MNLLEEASIERAKRRMLELKASGAAAPTFEEVRDQIAARDLSDSTRALAPLRKAPDAVEVDTSSMSLEEVVAHMESIARARLNLPKGS